MNTLRSAIAFGAIALAAVACGSGDESEFDPNAGANGPFGGGDGSETGGLGSGDPGKTGGVGAACATSSAKAEKLPLHMIVVLDKSGSMCEYTANQTPRDCNNANSKWQQVTTALASFFGAKESAGITASLVAFPSNNDSCSASSYQTPLRADVTLPDSGGQLASDMRSLTGSGTTPTRYALEGTMAYAKQLQSRLAGKGKVVVVLATDGYPERCNNNEISDSVQVASAVKASIPTYVIGVGGQLGNLKALAEGGGTTDALIISTQNASTVNQQFQAAIGQIRGASLSCDFALPQPEAGKELDPQKVNVNYTPGGSTTAETLDYSPDCKATQGWRYDNADSPSRIQLCGDACTRAKADATGKIDLVLGCVTKGGPGDVR